MSEPRTQAGRDLLANQWLTNPYGEAHEAMLAAIIVIEAEARAQGALHEMLAGEGSVEELARLREALTAIVESVRTLETVDDDGEVAEFLTLPPESLERARAALATSSEAEHA